MIYWTIRFLIGQRTLAWLGKFLDETDETVALKQGAYLAIMLAGIIWLSVDMAIKESGARRGIDANWVSAFGILVAATTAAKVWWRKKEVPQ